MLRQRAYPELLALSAGQEGIISSHPKGGGGRLRAMPLVGMEGARVALFHESETPAQPFLMQRPASSEIASSGVSGASGASGAMGAPLLSYLQRGVGASKAMQPEAGATLIRMQSLSTAASFQSAGLAGRGSPGQAGGTPAASLLPQQLIGRRYLPDPGRSTAAYNGDLPLAAMRAPGANADSPAVPGSGPAAASAAPVAAPYQPAIPEPEATGSAEARPAATQPAIDLEELVEKACKKIMRKMSIENERRGYR